MRLRALRFLFVLLVVLLAASLSLRAQVKDTMNLSNLNAAQELCRIIGSQFVVPTINYEPVTPPKFWTKGMQTELGFSQISLTNWAAGGSGSVALNTFVNASEIKIVVDPIYIGDEEAMAKLLSSDDPSNAKADKIKTRIEFENRFSLESNTYGK